MVVTDARFDPPSVAGSPWGIHPVYTARECVVPISGLYCENCGRIQECSRCGGAWRARRGKPSAPSPLPPASLTPTPARNQQAPEGLRVDPEEARETPPHQTEVATDDPGISAVSAASGGALVSYSSQSGSATLGAAACEPASSVLDGSHALDHSWPNLVPRRIGSIANSHSGLPGGPQVEYPTLFFSRPLALVSKVLSVKSPRAKFCSQVVS